MKRSGFTMIELIFVIVILGILAAVAIPKLAATRDDAEVAARATQIQTAVNEIGAYTTATNDFGQASFATMSVAAGAMIAANQAVDAAGVLTINDVRPAGTSTACVTISQGTKAWTGVASADANATVTAAAWTQANWDNQNLTKVVWVQHTAGNTSGGCDVIQNKIPVAITVVKGRSAQF